MQHIVSADRRGEAGKGSEMAGQAQEPPHGPREASGLIRAQLRPPIKRDPWGIRDFPPAATHAPEMRTREEVDLTAGVHQRIAKIVGVPRRAERRIEHQDACAAVPPSGGGTRRWEATSRRTAAVATALHVRG